MKKIYTLLFAIVISQFCFGQRIIITGFGGTGNCDGSFNFVVCGLTGFTYSVFGAGTTQNSTYQSNLCAGSYNVTVTAQSSATYSVSLNYSNTGQVTVTPLGGTNVFSSFAQILPSTNTTNCDGAIYLSIQGGIPAYTIVWRDPNANIISGQSNDTLLNVCPNGYGFEVSDNGSSLCQSAGGVAIPLSTQIISPKNEIGFSLYPNPTNGIFKLELNNQNITMLEIISVRNKFLKQGSY